MTRKQRKILVRMIVKGEAKLVKRKGKIKPKSLI
jgi:hypothetical protein